MEAKHLKTVMEYAESIRDGKKVACIETKQCVERFFRDIENPKYELDTKGPEFCIGIIERLLCHQQGETLDGAPLYGKPFHLQPFHDFIIYNLVGIRNKETGIAKFHEALIFIPRKNVKTTFVAALAWALSLYYRKSGSKVYITSAALLQQSLESFDFLKYNIERMKLDKKNGGFIKVIDNNNEHSMRCQLPDGTFYIRALAAEP